MVLKHPPLILSRIDYVKLNSLISFAESKTAMLLEEELNRARVVEIENLPADVVCMNSEVTFEDIQTGKEMKVTVVYPQDSDVDKGRISVLAPMGSALIGLRVDQTIDWPLPNGKFRTIRVSAVLSQPKCEMGTG